MRAWSHSSFTLSIKTWLVHINTWLVHSNIAVTSHTSHTLFIYQVSDVTAFSTKSFGNSIELYFISVTWFYLILCMRYFALGFRIWYIYLHLLHLKLSTLNQIVSITDWSKISWIECWHNDVNYVVLVSLLLTLNWVMTNTKWIINYRCTSKKALSKFRFLRKHILQS